MPVGARVKNGLFIKKSVFVLIQQNTVTFFSCSIRNYNAMTSEIQTKLSRFKDVLAGTLSEI